MSPAAPAGGGPLQTLLGASLIGAVLVLPLALATGQAVSPLRSGVGRRRRSRARGDVSVLAYAGYVAACARPGRCSRRRSPIW
jgi:hypothetical protein